MTVKEVTLRIDALEVTVPDKTLVVDAARKVGIDIPVFCYHPKMEPVGMCRMCLVDIGRPVLDKATGKLVEEEDGSLKIQFGPKLETACTTPVSEGMVVVTNSEKVKAARKEVLEFLLTSHPLDCPVCDKGGECPLQNLTMGFGPGQSRFNIDEKMHLDKHIPLGELIYLDRERCIQCGRCVRFQKEVVEEPVIGFSQRGRALEIMTCSNPGFDSIFSGNTTDICPVGALTTADFRFGARPWELKAVASLCNHCPVGCNLVYNVRREVVSGGGMAIKRVMPRQNEQVNEIWLCDKARFAYHYVESEERLTRPLLRKEGELVPVEWDEALDLAAEKLRAAGKKLVTLAGGRLSNEDLFNLGKLTRSQEGRAILSGSMAGGDLVAQVGVGEGSNFADMGKGSVILVAACNLHEEAPVWWLRVKDAVRRGATLIVANPRRSEIEKDAKHVIRYPYGEEARTLAAFVPASGLEAGDELRAAAATFAKAENAVILYGSEGLGLEGSRALVLVCAELLVKTDHVGRPNNGLIGVWPHGNTQGAWDMGFAPVPEAELAKAAGEAEVVWIAAADPAGDDPEFKAALDRAGFVIVQELFLTETARAADLILPAQAYVEREGSYTSGERRVQRFYPVLSPSRGPRADFTIAAQVADRLDLQLEDKYPASIFLQIAAEVKGYHDLTYPHLSEVKEQWPIIGRQDLYYGGTTYDNQQGLGVQLCPDVQRGEAVTIPEADLSMLLKHNKKGVMVVPVTCLYDQGSLMKTSPHLKQRLAAPTLRVNPSTAKKHNMDPGTPFELSIKGTSYPVQVVLDENVPAGVALVLRSVGVPVNGPFLL